MSRHPKPPNSTSPSAPSGTQTATVLPAALIATNVAKDYGDGPALYPLSVRVEEHERVALIGHNGSGKTTFLRIATGLLEPASGGITIFGQEPGSMAARSKLSYLADTPTF